MAQSTFGCPRACGAVWAPSSPLHGLLLCACSCHGTRSLLAEVCVSLCCVVASRFHKFQCRVRRLLSAGKIYSVLSSSQNFGAAITPFVLQTARLWSVTRGWGCQGSAGHAWCLCVQVGLALRFSRPRRGLHRDGMAAVSSVGG